MRQAGDNSPIAVKQGKTLSIQITQSGFSFSVSNSGEYLYGSHSRSYDFETIIGDSDRYNTILIGWNNDSVVLVPQSIFEAEYTEDYLQAANVISPAETPLLNQTLDPQIVAIWSADRDLVNLLVELFPEAYHYHNLQLDILRSEQESIRVSVIEDHANITISSRDGLQAAETIKFMSATDLLYFVSKINFDDKFARYPINFIADDTTSYQKLFREHFPKCTFTDHNNIYHSTVLQCE